MSAERRGSLVIRCIWAACLLVATANHARILIEHGLWYDYRGVFPASAVYWTSLTFIDPIVAALLFVRPKLGIVAAVLLITTNVVHNLAITAAYSPDDTFLARAASDPFILSQVGFMLFVFVTAKAAWRGTSPNRARHAGSAAS